MGPVTANLLNQERASHDLLPPFSTLAKNDFYIF